MRRAWRTLAPRESPPWASEILCFLWFHLGTPAKTLDIDALVPGQRGMRLCGGGGQEQDVARASHVLFPHSTPDGGC